MLNIDSSKGLIEITRGDSASLVVSAKDSGGVSYQPGEGDTLTLSVAKKHGADPLFSISNVYDGTHESAFWTVVIDPGHTEELKFGDYVWDVQLENRRGVQTIIGKTDDVSPVFRVWGEVAQQEVTNG